MIKITIIEIDNIPILGTPEDFRNLPQTKPMVRECTPKPRKPKDACKANLINKWCGARDRCKNKNNPSYHNYGGRGIELRFTSREWVDYILKHLGSPTSIKYIIDRIDNDGHYEPGNLRWVDMKESNINKRKTRGGWKWGKLANRRGKNIQGS